MHNVVVVFNMLRMTIKSQVMNLSLNYFKKLHKNGAGNINICTEIKVVAN